MRKYIIKGAYRSEYSNMKTEFNSRKDAINALIDYIYNYNKNLNDDDNLITPFDFIIKEIDVKDVNETITDFERAREMLGLKALGFLNKFDDVTKLISDINHMYIEALIALNKLFTLAEAWNKEDSFVPNFSDREQDKWFPLFKYNKDATGLVFAYSGSAWSCMLTDEYVVIVGSRLCFKSSERAAQFGKLFVDLYNKVFL